MFRIESEKFDGDADEIVEYLVTMIEKTKEGLGDKKYLSDSVIDLLERIHTHCQEYLAYMVLSSSAGTTQQKVYEYFDDELDFLLDEANEELNLLRKSKLN